MTASELPGYPDTSHVITSEDHNVMAGDMLNYSEDDGDDETWWTVFEVEDESLARVYANGVGFETWDAEDVREKLRDDEWYHWYLLNRQFVTRESDGEPITYAFYTFAIESPLLRETAGDGKLAYMLWWDELRGVEEVTSMPDLEKRELFPTISQMYTECLNPETSDKDDVSALADAYERHDAARLTMESVMESTDHNANIRIQTGEPRVFETQEWDIVESTEVTGGDDADVATTKRLTNAFNTFIQSLKSR